MREFRSSGAPNGLTRLKILEATSEGRRAVAREEVQKYRSTGDESPSGSEMKIRGLNRKNGVFSE
jgi:hypothetical protein